MCVYTATVILAVGTLLLKATADAVNANADIKEANQKIDYMRKQAKNAEDKASYVRQKGIEDARDKKLKSILEMGDTSTNIAAGNIALTSGTAINVLDSQKMNGEIEASSVLESANRRADDYMFQAQDYYNNAQLTSMSAKRTRNNFFMSTGIRAAETAKSLYGKYGMGE